MADNGNVIAIHSKAAWDEQIARSKNENKLVVVDFTATWCGPCKMMAPVFVELSLKHENVIFLKVDVDEMNALVSEYRVNAMPTFVFIKDGAVVDSVVGARVNEFKEKVLALSK